MKLTTFTKLLAVGLVLTVAATACKKRPTELTVLPAGARTGLVEGPGPGAMIDPSKAGFDENASGRNSGMNAADSTSGIPFNGPGHPGWLPNAEIFDPYTVYFDFDSSVVNASERSKVEAVAQHLRSNPASAVRVEGHCDERGTEEYNRALGDRRALAVREELIGLGIDPTRVDTISYGKDRPADPGQGEEAWRKNRRGEFVLLMPPGA
jgi:peptidoglycan-associated lipoprotein